MNFELILTSVVLFTGAIVLLDRLMFAPARKIQHGVAYPTEKNPAFKLSLWVEYSRSLFPVLLFVLCLRSFVVEPFRIPSGSLKPTLLVGDFVLVNKYIYGLRLPILHTKFYDVSEPQLGDVVVFRWPPNPSIDYIKRIVGLPNERLSYIDKTLAVDHRVARQQMLNAAVDSDDQGNSWPIEIKSENLDGVDHKIYIRPDTLAENFYNLRVPKGSYFAMGDNRDDSADSRYWGFVPEANLAGKAFMILFSWDSENYRVRWERIGLHIN